MTCPTHGNLCAFPEPSDARCSVCHCDWSKITAPAEERTTITGRNRKTGEPTAYDEIRYLFGYGETIEAHLARHAVSEARVTTQRARRDLERAALPIGTANAADDAAMALAGAQNDSGEDVA
jgi:hypothetical protein